MPTAQPFPQPFPEALWPRPQEGAWLGQGVGSRAACLLRLTLQESKDGPGSPRHPDSVPGPCTHPAAPSPPSRRASELLRAAQAGGPSVPSVLLANSLGNTCLDDVNPPVTFSASPEERRSACSAEKPASALRRSHRPRYQLSQRQGDPGGLPTVLLARLLRVKAFPSLPKPKPNTSTQRFPPRPKTSFLSLCSTLGFLQYLRHGDKQKGRAQLEQHRAERTGTEAAKGESQGHPSTAGEAGLLPISSLQPRWLDTA